MPIDLSKIKNKLNPPPDGQDVAKLRTAVVSSVGTDGKATITLNGAAISDVPILDNGAKIGSGTVVQMISYRGSLLILGPVRGGNPSEIVGSVSLTAVTANVVVSSTVTFPSLGGTGTVAAFVTANTSAPGSANSGVNEVSASSVSATSVTVNMSRNGLTTTTVYYQVKRFT